MTAHTALRLPPPSADPFYDAVPAAAPPGTVLRARTVHVATAEPSRARQVVYVSTDSLGRPTAMSGTILMPNSPWPADRRRPVVSFGVGVHGLTRDAAPSHLLRCGTEAELTLIEAALARGWAVAVADGEGLGMPGPHTYGAGRSGGQAMLDILRAAPDVAPGLAPKAPVALWGYSEGGRCAIWAAELAPAYAPELPLVGVAAGGVPTDLYAVARAIDEGPFAGLNLAVLIGLARAHGRPDLLGILTDQGRRVAAHAEGLDLVRLVLGCRRPLASLTAREEPWDDPAWLQLLEQERAGQGLPAAPVYLYHGDQDAIVPPYLARDLARTYRDRGVDVTAVEVEAPDHLSGAFLGAVGAVHWLAGRFAEGTGSASNPARRPWALPSGAWDAGLARRRP